MKLLVKFNLLFIVVFAIGIGVSGWLTRDLLQRNAREEVLDTARLMMEQALAVRTFTSKQITPLLQTQMNYTFLPQSVPSFAAAEVILSMKSAYPEFQYKDATLNPTNPRDRAVGWEVDIVDRFRSRDDSTEFVGERDTPAGRALFIARPIKITDPACLRCHSTVEAAPRSLIDTYGPANGFGWQHNETVGAQLVSVPMAVPLARAARTWQVFMASLAGVFVAIGVALNLMLYALVIRPVVALSRLADRVSLGEMDAPEFERGARDEIGTLAESFARMRKSLAQAMKMIEG